jgi:hypothetical protein
MDTAGGSLEGENGVCGEEIMAKRVKFTDSGNRKGFQRNFVYLMANRRW